MPMHYTAIIFGSKNEKIDKKNGNFLIFAQNIDCGYTFIEPAQCEAVLRVPTIYVLVEQK